MNHARPFPRRWWFWLLIALAGVMVVTVIIVRRPGLAAQRLASIRASGLPAVWHEVEQFYPPVPPEENGAPALLSAVGQINFDTTHRLPRRHDAWTDETHVWAQQQAERNTAAAAALHDALQRTQWRFPITFQGNPALTPLRHLSPHKRAANLLQLQAIQAAVQADAAGATQALHDNLRLARTLDGEPILISYLVRVAELAIASSALEQVLSRVALDEAQLAGLQTAFAEAITTNTLFRALAGERAFGSSFFTLPTRELLQTLGSTGGSSGTAPTGSELLQASLYTVYGLSGLRSSDFRFYLDQMEQLLRAAALPAGPDTRTTQSEFEQAMDQIQGRFDRLLSRMVLPALSKSVDKEVRSVATLRAAVTACAVERFRVAHDRLPTSLEELVPQFLESVPEDPLDGRPLKFRRLSPGYVVYSLGDDGTDDGGVEYANRPKNSSTGWDYTFTVER